MVEAPRESYGRVRPVEQPECSEGKRDPKREYERCAKQERRALPAPSAWWNVASVCDRPGQFS